MKQPLKIAFLSLMILLGAVFAAPAMAQRSDSIAAVVNGNIITYTDLYDRMDLIIKSSNMPDTAEFKQKLLPQVLTGLITEQIQMQEAERLGLNVSEAELDKGFEELSAQNNLKPEQFKEILSRQNINADTLTKQIESQLAWGKVIQRELRPRITLTDTDINSEIDRLKARDGEQEYLVAEIFLPVDDSTTDEKVRKGAQNIAQQLSKDPAKFAAAARQFSQSSTAANGGVIGWVSPEQMTPAIGEAIRSTPVKSLSRPVKDENGYTILYIREKRTIKLDGSKGEEKMRIKNAVFTLPHDDEVKRKTIEEEATNFAHDVTGCLDINRRILGYDNASVEEIYDLISAIPDDLKNAVKGTNIGETGQILHENDRIIIPMLCGRDGGTENSALEREVETRIGTQRLDVLQKRYLRDLISDAYIERRV